MTATMSLQSGYYIKTPDKSWLFEYEHAGGLESARAPLKKIDSRSVTIFF